MLSCLLFPCVSVGENTRIIIVCHDFPPGRTVVSDWRDWTSSSDFWRLGWWDFFVPTVLLSTFIPFFLTSSSLSLIVLFQSCCSHAQVFGRTLVHEFLFSYSHTEWNLLFLKQTPLWHEATWDKPEASIKTETEEEEEEEDFPPARWEVLSGSEVQFTTLYGYATLGRDAQKFLRSP